MANGKCAAAPISKYKGVPCTNDTDCPLAWANGSSAGNSKCECGFNGGGYSYCALSEGDSEYRDVIKAYGFMEIGNIYCHTLLRWGPCEGAIHNDDYVRYNGALKKF